jgi:hypothetical protein
MSLWRSYLNGYGRFRPSTKRWHDGTADDCFGVAENKSGQSTAAAK